MVQLQPVSPLASCSPVDMLVQPEGERGSLKQPFPQQAMHLWKQPPHNPAATSFLHPGRCTAVAGYPHPGRGTAIVSTAGNPLVEIASAQAACCSRISTPRQMCRSHFPSRKCTCGHRRRTVRLLKKDFHTPAETLQLFPQQAMHLWKSPPHDPAAASFPHFGCCVYVDNSNDEGHPRDTSFPSRNVFLRISSSMSVLNGASLWSKISRNLGNSFVRA